jgi:hypothetical protein
MPRLRGHEASGDDHPPFPDEWEGFSSFNHFVEVMVDNKTIDSSAKKVPATYKKNFPSWDKMGKYQKMVMINAWENASIDTKEAVLFQESRSELEYQ